MRCSPARPSRTRSPPDCQPRSPWPPPIPDLAAAIAGAIARPHFRPYVSTDVIGAEIGGAIKNILAIACGIVDGAGLGLNARAALISRGFAEMTRFGLARGAQAETLAGLAGLGDLVLTCTSANSRNFALGQGLGRGDDAATLMADRRTVAEGAFSAPVIAAAARADGIDMPICDTVARLVAGGNARCRCHSGPAQPPAAIRGSVNCSRELPATLHRARLHAGDQQKGRRA